MKANCVIIKFNGIGCRTYSLNEIEQAKEQVEYLRSRICGTFTLYYGFREYGKDCMRTDTYEIEPVRKADGTPF